MPRLSGMGIAVGAIGAPITAFSGTLQNLTNLRVKDSQGDNVPDLSKFEFRGPQTRIRDRPMSTPFEAKISDS